MPRITFFSRRLRIVFFYLISGVGNLFLPAHRPGLHLVVYREGLRLLKYLQLQTLESGVFGRLIRQQFLYLYFEVDVSLWHHSDFAFQLGSLSYLDSSFLVQTAFWSYFGSICFWFRRVCCTGLHRETATDLCTLCRRNYWSEKLLDALKRSMIRFLFLIFLKACLAKLKLFLRFFFVTGWMGLESLRLYTDAVECFSFVEFFAQSYSDVFAQIISGLSQFSFKQAADQLFLW